MKTRRESTSLRIIDVQVVMNSTITTRDIHSLVFVSSPFRYSFDLGFGVWHWLVLFLDVFICLIHSVAMLVDFHLFICCFFIVFGVVDLSFLYMFFSFACLNCYRMQERSIVLCSSGNRCCPPPGRYSKRVFNVRPGLEILLKSDLASSGA
jgi:hypothetical protein